MTILLLSPGSGHAAQQPIRTVPPVSGTILGPSGNGLAGARVEIVPLLASYEAGRRRLERRPEPEPVARTASDEAGRFRLVAPEPGVFRVVVRAGGYLPMQYLPLVVAAATELPPVTLKRSREAAIRVAGPSGRPIAGAWVFVRTAGEARASRGNPSPWRPDFRLGLTDLRGRLVFPHTDGEPIAATAFPPRAPPVKRSQLTGEVLTVSSEAGQPRTLRVVDARGEPVAGVLARVGELSWPLTMTAADGLVELVTRPDEELAVRLLTADGRQEKVELAPHAPQAAVSAAPREVVLPDPLTVRGRVLDAVGHQPLAGAVVWPGPDPGAFVRTDSQGWYAIAVPTRERFRLQVEAAGHVPRHAWVSRSELAAGRVASIALPPAVAIAGRVVDTAGDEVAGAWLAAMPRGLLGPRPFTAPDRADGRTVTDAGGKFALHRLQPGEAYTLIASRPGYATATATAFAPRVSGPTPHVEIVLVPDRPAVGRVVNLEEQPIPEAVVALSVHGVSPRAGALPAAVGPGEEDPFRARTDADGRFRIAAVPAAELDVTVTAAGYAPMVVRQVQVVPGKGPADLGTFVLVPGVGITGKVEDADGRPIAGAGVHALAEELGERALRSGVRALGLERRKPEAETAADGTFAVKSLPAGIRKTLWIQAEGFLPASVGGVEARTAEPLVVVLERARAVAGRVVDEAGEPIAGADLEISWKEVLPGTEGKIGVGARDFRSTLSDREGWFELTGVPPGPAELGVRAERFVVPELLEVEVPAAGGIDDLVLVLERGAVVTGWVTDDDGEPLGGVRVVAGKAGAYTDVEGRYRVEGARPGAGTARAFHPHYGRFERRIEIEPGVNSLDWTLPAGREVSGHVFDVREEPVPAAEVRLTLRNDLEPRSYRARSAADGSFFFPTVAAGSYTLAAAAPSYAPSEQTEPVVVADEPVSELAITLERGATVSGRILGLDFDALARVRVEARDRERSFRGRVDYEGGYEITDLPPGSWLLTATLDAGRRQAQARVALPPGTPSVVRDLEFGGGFVLSGRVLHDGEPLPGASVAIRGEQTATERSVATDHRGEFRFTELDGGEYWLGVSHLRELVTHNDVIVLDADQELVVDLRSATVRATVIEAGSARPLAEAIVALSRHGAGQGMIAAGSDGEGRVSIPRVPAGRYTVITRKDGYAPARAEIEVVAGQDVEGIEIVLSPTPGLELGVVLASGQAPTEVDVMVIAPDGGVLLAEPRPITAQGRVRVPTVPPGEWEILVSARGGGLTAAHVTVPGELVPLVLPPAGRMQVRVPELETSTLIARLSLLGGDGQPLRAIDLAARGLRDHWPLVGGSAAVDAVPAGLWIVKVEAPDGRSWTRPVTATGGDLAVTLN